MGGVGGWVSSPENKAKPSLAGAWSLTWFCNDYIGDTGEFKCKEYFMFFIKCIYEIIQTLKLPAEFSMKSLSTKYTPCLVCMKKKY